MYINHDLARALLEERRRLAAKLALTRLRPPQPVIEKALPDADVIELAFGTHCENEQIGA
jgi:hypothetical protein